MIILGLIICLLYLLSEVLSSSSISLYSISAVKNQFFCMQAILFIGHYGPIFVTMCKHAPFILMSVHFYYEEWRSKTQ